MTGTYPFSAIVGQDDLKAALLINAVDARIGGLLILGERGTAKSTAARALAALLPATEVHAGSAVRCGPGDEDFDICVPSTVERVPASFVDLPIGATEDRVIGTLDLQRTVASGSPQFEPGLLADANRGVLYIDEVNLLPDHLVDLLLDVASSGVNVIERDGLSVRHPSRFLLIGTMNPEEGELRTQFVDRFGLAVTIEASKDPEVRGEIVRRRLAFDGDPVAFQAAMASTEAELADRVLAARDLLGQVVLPDAMVSYAVSLALEASADGLRADVTICRAATVLAALEGCRQVASHHVDQAARLALAHRRSGSDDRHRVTPPPPPGQPPSPGIKPPPVEGEAGPPATDSADQDSANPAAAQAEQPPDESAAMRLLLPEGPLPRRITTADSRRRAHLSGPGLRVIGSMAPGSGSGRLHLWATVQAAAREGRVTPSGPDVRVTRRTTGRKRLVVFVVDASGSMGIGQRMARTKGALLKSIEERYVRRDYSALVAFGGDGAWLLAPPARSVTRALRALERLKTGGRTPLAAGVGRAVELIGRWRPRLGQPEALLVVVTDGRARVDELDRAGVLLRRSSIAALVVDTEAGPLRLGLARRIADKLAADYLRLEPRPLSAVAAAGRDPQ